MYVVVEPALPDVSAPGLVNELQARGAGVIGGPIISSVPEYSLPSESHRRSSPAITHVVAASLGGVLKAAT